MNTIDITNNTSAPIVVQTPDYHLTTLTPGAKYSWAPKPGSKQVVGLEELDAPSA